MTIFLPVAEMGLDKSVVNECTFAESDPFLVIGVLPILGTFYHAVFHRIEVDVFAKIKHVVIDADFF